MRYQHLLIALFFSLVLIPVVQAANTSMLAANLNPPDFLFGSAQFQPHVIVNFSVSQNTDVVLFMAMNILKPSPVLSPDRIIYRPSPGKWRSI